MFNGIGNTSYPDITLYSYEEITKYLNKKKEENNQKAITKYIHYLYSSQLELIHKIDDLNASILFRIDRLLDDWDKNYKG